LSFQPHFFQWSNNVFLSQQISQQYFSACLFSKTASILDIKVDSHVYWEWLHISNYSSCPPCSLIRAQLPSNKIKYSWKHMLLNTIYCPMSLQKHSPCIGAMPTCHHSISMSELITNLNGQIYSNRTDVLLQTHDLPYYTISLLCMHACLPSLMHIMHYQRTPICSEIVCSVPNTTTTMLHWCQWQYMLAYGRLYIYSCSISLY